MFYRYDPTNINCEVFEYARKRASHFYRYHKNRFCGDIYDLHQTALMAIVEAVAGIEDKSQIPEELMMTCVDTALQATIKKFVKESPIQDNSSKVGSDGSDLQHDNEAGLLTPDPVVMTGRAIVKMQEFREFLEKVLTPEKLEIVWQILVLGFSEQDIVNKSLEKQAGSGKWNRLTKNKVKRLLAEATATIELKMPEDLIAEIAKLKVERE